MRCKEGPIPLNNETQVLTPDITTENGVIHVIDSILNEKINITDSLETTTERKIKTINYYFNENICDF